MKKLFTLLTSVVALFTVSCEGLDLSSVYSPEHLIQADNEYVRWDDANENFMICPEGCDFSIDIEGVLNYMQADLASMLKYEVSYPQGYNGEEWIVSPDIEEIIDQKYLDVEILENTTDVERAATIKFILTGDSPVDAYYGIELVQMPTGYKFPENNDAE